MTPNDYQAAAVKTANPNLDQELHVCIMAMGLAGETGELVDYLKKHIGHGHDLSTFHVEEEIGDILWYLANLADFFDLDLDRAMQHNIQKLAKRYPDGFDPERSRNREIDSGTA